MSRRTAAGLLALALTAALLVYGVVRPTNYITLSPGPTIDVLGKVGSKPLIQITGRKSYVDDGELRMVTVYQTSPQTKLSVIDVLKGWVDPDVTVVSREVVYPKKTTNAQQQQQSAAQMTSSQDNATAAALTALGIGFRTGIVVADVLDGPSKGKLEARDELVSIDGVPVKDVDSMVAGIQAKKPGTTLQIVVKRKGVEKTFAITTVPAEKEPAKSRIAITAGEDYVFPFTVKINIPENVGGPSAGMMFALSIYDLLTPGSLTDGKVIAGSGTIDAKGVVGSIGGIGQKIASAQRDGAHLFLVAEENCAEAARSHYDKSKIRLVKVHTLTDAIDEVTAWTENPSAKLPGCA